MAILNIDGQDVEVMTYLWSKKDIDLDSGRNLAGVMERNLLPHRVNTLTVTFPPQNQYERQRTINILDKETLIIRFLSPKTNQIETGKFMHGDIDSELYWNVNINGQEEVLYNAFQVKLVEY